MPNLKFISAKPEAKCRACRFSQCAAAGARLTGKIYMCLSKIISHRLFGYFTNRSERLDYESKLEIVYLGQFTFVVDSVLK
jgi:hypothetical protein